MNVVPLFRKFAPDGPVSRPVLMPGAFSNRRPRGDVPGTFLASRTSLALEGDARPVAPRPAAQPRNQNTRKGNT